MSDPFSGTLDSVSSPATRGSAIVPHDGNALPSIPKAIYVGTGGTIVMRGAGADADSVFKNVPAGMVLPFRPSHVRATGTSAADLIALS